MHETLAQFSHEFLCDFLNFSVLFCGGTIYCSNLVCQSVGMCLAKMAERIEEHHSLREHSER